MKYTFRDLAAEVLEKAAVPLSSDEIWERALSTDIAQKIGSTGKTPAQTVGAQIYVDMRDNGENSIFVTAGIRPRRFTLRKLMSSKQAEALITKSAQGTEPEKHSSAYLEHHLHPLLAYYADHYMRVFAKTINHTKSSKKEFGEWVHPDMVGCQFPFMSWSDKVYQLATAINDVSISLYSFELKREISFSNLREVFFQAVSNSSWANEGYLVAAVISEDEELREELSRLSSSFGIGVILLSTTDPDSSEVLFPARTKEYIDWTMVNKLSAMNSDFNAFLERVRKDIQTKEVRKESYDSILTSDELILNIQKSSK